MRKVQVIILLLLAVLPLATIAQVQNGYVRTKGTSINRKGSPIPQVQVFINGLNGAKVTAANGTFNFNLGGGKTQYSVASVVKTGYSLFTPLASSYNVGNARLELVMQSRKEKAEEEARIAEKVEANITAGYEKKKDKLQKEIEGLKKNNTSQSKKINQLEEELAKLYEQYVKCNDLIDKMVEEYVNLDYATLDDRKAQLCTFIENGELERADSLLSTIDISEKMNNIKTLRTDIKEKKEQVNTEEQILKQNIDEACMYWRGKYDVAVQNLQYDSAMVYVKQLADVDTTNYDNVFQCAYFLHQEKEFYGAEHYYQVCLRQINNAEATDSTSHNLDLAKSYNNLGILYNDLHNYDKAEEYYLQALAIRKELASANLSAYNPDLANSYNDLGILHHDLHNYDKAEKYYLQALAIRKELASANPSAYNLDSFYTLGNLSYVTIFNLKFKEAEQYANEALALDSTQTWIKTNLVTSILFQGRYTEAVKIALEIKDVMWQDKPLKESILDDLKAFDEKGIIPEQYKTDVEKLRAVLNQ